MENFIQQKIPFKLVNHNQLQIMLNICFVFSLKTVGRGDVDEIL